MQLQREPGYQVPLVPGDLADRALTMVNHSQLGSSYARSLSWGDDGVGSHVLEEALCEGCREARVEGGTHDAHLRARRVREQRFVGDSEDRGDMCERTEEYPGTQKLK